MLGILWALGLSAGEAAAEVRAVERLWLSPAPLRDEVLDHGLTPEAGVLNAAPDARPDILGPTEITGFQARGAKRVRRLKGPVRAEVRETLPAGEAPPAGDRIRNYWGAQGAEEDGAAALLGLDLSTGVDNALGAEVYFAAPMLGAPGPGNDILLTDLFGDDSVRVAPLDAQGRVIGAGLVIASGPGPNNIETRDPGAWGWVGVDLTVAIETLPETLFSQRAGPGAVFDNLKVAAVAFDVEDLFAATEARAPVHGLRLTGLELGSGKGSFDLGVAAVNARGMARR